QFLAAQDAEGLAIDREGHVQQRARRARSQIALPDGLQLRVGVRVGARDKTLLAQAIEIGLVALHLQRIARGGCRALGAV
ncbi:hypothetical protein Q6288_29055, partial [Klebsiella quasipneumoniae]|uniref:hypothetical protein n=1 Tax=Klebsiella quasipneumoniae TaxID=1463165 RepID=UPI00272F3DDA